MTIWSVAAFGQAAPSSFTAATRYDAMGRVVGTIAPSPDGSNGSFLATRTTYDAAGRVIKVEQGALSAWQSDLVSPVTGWGSAYTMSSAVETAYDAQGRKATETTRGSDNQLYGLTQYSYDALGRLECTAVRMNPAAFGSLPSSACTLGTQGGHGPDRITRNVYDAAGQLLKVQKAVGTSVQIDYARYEYTLNGKQSAVIDANGNRAEFAYDGLDRQAKWTFPSSSTPGAVNAADYEQYGYDASGNRTSMRKRDGRTFTFTYDGLNRMTAKVVPDACVSGYACTNVAASATRDVYYSYDLRGLQTAARFDSAAGADAVLSVYDGFGQLVSSTTAMGGVSRTIGYQYNADGARTRVTHPDGNYVNYYREGLDRLYYADLNNAAPLFYPPYDAAGRVSVLYRWVGGNWYNYTAFSYDGISRLSSSASALTSGGYNVTSTFAYNPASQITTRTRSNDAYAFTGYASVNRSYAVNGLNQYTSAGSATFGYDSNGNLTSDGTFAYTYDAENRLVVTSAGANLVYDPLGRLYETYKASTGTTRFLYDGDQLTAEYDASGNILRRYVHSDGEDDPLIWYEGSGVSSPRYLYADHQGSITAVTDASGNVTRINAYDEYGIPNAGNEVATAGRFQYTGQAWLPELGMYYYKARIYSPTLGRFLQTDPIGYEDQVNLYAYVSNDPVNGRDPTGNQDARAAAGACAAQPEVCVVGIAAAAGLATTMMWAAQRSDFTINGHVNSAGSLPPPTLTHPDAISETRSYPAAARDTRRLESFVVVVQIQGSRLGQNNSAPLAENTPITGAEVKGTISGLLKGLSRRQQAEAVPAVIGAFKQIDRAMASGGLEAGQQIRGMNKKFAPREVRVDVLVIKGRNIQY